MVAKKAPMKKMAAPAKPVAKKKSSSSEPLPLKKLNRPAASAANFRKADQESMVKYNKFEKQTVDAAGKLRKKYPFSASDFKGVTRKEFVSGFADVVSEGAPGQNPVWMRAAERVASEAWDKKFGKKKK